MVSEKHKNLKVSMRFTQKNLYKKTNEKKREGSIIQGIGVWWCQKNKKSEGVYEVHTQKLIYKDK